MITIKPTQADLLDSASKNITIELRSGHSPSVYVKGIDIFDSTSTVLNELSSNPKVIAPHTVFEAVLLARKVANLLNLDVHLVESNGNTLISHKEQIITREFTRDDVREVLKNHGICSDSITIEMINPLRELLSKHLKLSGIYEGTASLVSPDPANPRAIKMKTCQWDAREAITFNKSDGGFVGFAGWASDKNAKPILLATLEWSYNNNVKPLD
ncbi:hypothetical protein OTK49_03290 [Vibrio coralliirubri]|uniref:hypothetical protein n=1 Tax=Vibrio coralliirubri TaxID=1516159 RepID=UPI002284B669|nr:hypothetical protein [Vibrio coralliirubri]MCY9861541.1 hypothetical protein [Vibrio coralliirubri]